MMKVTRLCVHTALFSLLLLLSAAPALADQLVAPFDPDGRLFFEKGKWTMAASATSPGCFAYTATEDGARLTLDGDVFKGTKGSVVVVCDGIAHFPETVTRGEAGAFPKGAAAVQIGPKTRVTFATGDWERHVGKGCVSYVAKKDGAKGTLTTADGGFVGFTDFTGPKGAQVQVCGHTMFFGENFEFKNR
jgi:hypothetical protein